MVGILLVTHGAFGAEIIKSVELIIGKQKNISHLSLTHGDRIEELAIASGKEIEKLDTGNGVLVFVDLFGGSPSNIIGSLMRRDNLECITGLNMGMLIEATEGQATMGLSDLKDACLKIGHSAIIDLRSELSLRK